MRRYLTAEQVLDRYRISPTTLWRWQHDAPKRFPRALRVGHRRLWNPDELDAFDARMAQIENT